MQLSSAPGIFGPANPTSQAVALFDVNGQLKDSVRLLSSFNQVITPAGIAAIDTLAISGSLAANGYALLSTGTFLINSAIIVNATQSIVGQGVRATVLRLDTSINDDVIRSSGYNSLTTGSAWANVPHSINLRNFSVDGNNGNNTGNGGIKILSFDDRIENVEVFNAAATGLIHASPANFQENIGYSAGPKSYMMNVASHHNTMGGIRWDGGSDSIWHGVEAYLNGAIVGGNPVNTGSVSIGIELGGQAFGLQATNCHSWGRNQKYAWKLGTDAMLVNCKGEGAQTAQCLILVNQTIIYGGKWFCDVNPYDANAYVFQIGDASHTVANIRIDTEVSQANAVGTGQGATIWFANDGGSSKISLCGWQTFGGAVAFGVKNGTTILDMKNSDLTTVNGVLFERDRIQRDARLSCYTNLLSNQSFEANTNGWAANGGVGTLTKDTTWFYTGTACAKIAYGPSVGSNFPGIQTALPIAVNTGNRYALECVIYRSVAGANPDVLKVDWFTSIGGFISSSATNSTTGIGEKMVRVVSYPPATAASGNIVSFTQTNNGESLANYYDEFAFYVTN